MDYVEVSEPRWSIVSNAVTQWPSAAGVWAQDILASAERVFIIQED